MQDSSQNLQVDNSIKNVNNLNIKKICRICLSQFDLGVPLFECSESLNNTTPASLILNCFDIKVQQSDKLPNQICNECSLNILISHNFKIQLQQSQKLLQTQISDNLPDEIETEIKEVAKDYDSLLQSLKVNKLQLEDDEVLLIVTDESGNVKSASSAKKAKRQSYPEVPKNLPEAYKWLQIARRLGSPYKCKVCSRYCSSSYRTFYMHVRLHFIKKVQCPLCPMKYFPYRKKYHMRKHTKEKPYICANCGKSFSMKNNLNQHLKYDCGTHTETTCKICEQVFTSYKLLHTHLLKEHGTCRHECNKDDCESCKNETENKHMCEYCGLKVLRYNRHLNTCKSAPIDIKFQLQNATTCDKCGELLFSTYQIKCHMKTHQDRVKHPCIVCGKLFLRKQYLKDHMEIHEPGEYECEICNKVFKRRLLLKKHKSTHKIIKNRFCPVCSKSFKTQDQLNKHIFVHSKLKPYICSICNKSFSIKGNLTKHLVIHEKVKPFMCSVCSKSFALKGNLTKHMIVHERFKEKNAE